MRRTLRFVLPILALAAVTVSAMAQAPKKTAADTTREDDKASTAASDPFGYGLVLGDVDYGNGRSSQSASVVVQYKPASWLTFAASPSYARSAVMRTRTYAVTGMTDLPVSVAASYDLDVAYSPTLEAGLGVTMPTGDSARGFGSGQVGFSAELGAGFAPADGWNLAVGAGKSFSNAGYASTFGAGTATSLSGSASYDFSAQLTGNMGVTSEVGGASGQAGEVAAGVVIPIAKPLAFTVDVSTGYGTGSPNYTLSIGFGTAVSGISPVSLMSPFRRLRSVRTAATGSQTLTAYCTRLGRC